MEDRYLYRAKRKKWELFPEAQQWVQGYYVHTAESDYIVSPYEHTTLLGEGETVEIEVNTLCQCTGLKDKNGKLIWENDIVTGWFDGKCITGYIMYGSNAIFFIERKGLYGIHLDNSEDWLEVIGNIFDEGSENIGKGAEEN